MDDEDVRSPTVSTFSAVEIRHPSVYRDDENRNLNDLLNDFKSTCEGLERQLEMFSSSVRQLGSSLGLYKGSREFQQQLSNIRRLLEDESQIELLVNTPKTSRLPTETWVHRDLWLLVDSIKLFSTAWDDFPEFTDNDRRHYFVALEQDLLVWLNILGCYDYSPEFLRCVRELLLDTILELGHVTRRLADFIATGVQEISFAQKHSTQILWNTATIATFFSAVTVTTIQYSYLNVQSPLQVAVNTLWFSSLVLSVSSAINSLLRYDMETSNIQYTSAPSPLVGASVVQTDSHHSTLPNRFTEIVVSTLTAIVALGLGAISVWFAWERWDFSRLRRKLWLHGEPDSLESSWGMFAYEYIVGIIWRSTSTSLPTRSPSRRHRILTTQSPGSFILRRQSLTDDSNTSGNRRGRLHLANDQGPLNHDVTTPTVPYSDAVFAEFALQRSLRLGHSEDMVRHLQFSPKGTWFAACTKSICYIYQVKPQITVHRALKHPFGQIRQLEWSPDEKHLLIRVSGGIELWEVTQNNMENRQKEWMGKIIKKVQWINNMGK
ncbi:WD40 repeat-like protein [Mycena venus]|uniref:WD40 repeat-like protein n=1 Tax=Mycena venus TaxID=2733690 RepID=A0A8H6WXP5_9AGAR|nr:WD40 repeat-like protein [Mycena venus]